MKKGDLVVCVNSENFRKKCEPIYKNKVYEIREIHFCPVNGEKCLYLVGIKNVINKSTGNEYAYRANRFVVINAPESISIESILNQDKCKK